MYNSCHSCLFEVLVCSQGYQSFPKYNKMETNLLCPQKEEGRAWSNRNLLNVLLKYGVGLGVDKQQRFRVTYVGLRRETGYTHD